MRAANFQVIPDLQESQRMQRLVSMDKTVYFEGGLYGIIPGGGICSLQTLPSPGCAPKPPGISCPRADNPKYPNSTSLDTAPDPSDTPASY